MCSHSVRIEWDILAVQNLEDIYDHGVERWSTDQADVYLARVLDVIRTIGEHPGIGKSRDDIGSGVRSFPVVRHVVYYRSSKSTLSIVAILHSNADVLQSLMREVR